MTNSAEHRWHACLVSFAHSSIADIHDHQVADLDDQQWENARPLEYDSRNRPAFRIHVVLVRDQDDASNNSD
jgi:hypothetical protein